MITILHQEAVPFKLSLWRYCLFDVGMFSSSQKALVVPDIIVYFLLDGGHSYSQC